MSEIFFWFAIFFVSLFVLIKASDFFIEAAEKIGIYFRLPTFVMGFTIVAFGTSLPELSSAIISVLEGSSEIVIGNVIGANIANLFLVLGTVAVIGRKMILNNKCFGN